MITSIPNLLTLSRIVLIAPLVGLFYLDNAVGYWAAFGIYVFACITDFFDGYVARHLNQLSKLGRFLDPIADKLLVACILLMLVANGIIEGVHVLPGVVILVREIVVSGLREFLAELKVGVPVSRLAKWKTTVQMLALGFLIVGPAVPPVFQTILIGQVLLWIAAALTMVTGYDYLTTGLRHMTGREEPGDGTGKGARPKTAAPDAG